MNEKDKKKMTKEKVTGLRKYRRLTVLFISILLFISLYNTVTTNIDWKFNNIVTEISCLIIILITGMYANVNNGFSLFHIRGLKMTNERLTSVLIGLFFPLVFILYVMINNDSFMKYVRNISLHNFITLTIFLIPVFIVIALIIYISYLIIEKRNKRLPSIKYSEEKEQSLDLYKKQTITLLLTVTFLSIWIKVGYNLNWYIYDIKTEIILIIIVIVMNIIGNAKNHLQWNYVENKKLGKEFYFMLSTPYILMILAFLVSEQFRDKVLFWGFKECISKAIYVFPLILLVSLVLYLFSKITDKSIKKESQKKFKKRKENIIVSLSITLIVMILLFIYILTEIVDMLTIELLLQMVIVFIPLSVIIYLVFYYSIKDINR